MEARKARSALDSAFGAGEGAGAVAGSGGTRTLCPAASRVLALARAAIDAYLAGAEQLLEPAVRQVGVMAL